jgi:AAA15 family ATPase/GTPase
MFKNITIKNFRGIESLTINAFKKINVFVGNNNCGKSSVLEALFMLTAPTNAELPYTINKLRGFPLNSSTAWRSLFYNLDTDQKIYFEADLNEPNEKRTLSIRPSYGTTSDFQKPNKTHPESFSTAINMGNSDAEPSGVSLESTMKKGAKSKKIKKFKAAIIVDSLGFNVQRPGEYVEQRLGVLKMRNAVDPGIAKRLDKLVLRKKTQEIVDILKQFEPSIEGISIASNNSVLIDTGIKRLVPLQAMGDGTLKVLSIILSIYDCQNGAIYIDELDNGLHYTAQLTIWKAMIHSAIRFNVQLFVTTHSFECISSLLDSISEEEKAMNLIGLYRIECETDAKEHTLVEYDSSILKEAVNNNWEVR